MGLLSIIATISAKQLGIQDRALAPEERPSVQSPTPLNMYQGSAVVLPQVDIALAQVDGSFVKPLTCTQIVTAQGKYEFLNHVIYNAYLAHGKAYVQLVCDTGDKLLEARLFTHYAEVVPTTVEEWEFWLGACVRDHQGHVVLDSLSKPVVKDHGLIGWPQFSIDGPPATVYDRAWPTGPQGVPPVKFTETITGPDGTVTLVQHQAMEYFRKIGDGTVTESLLATACQAPDDASVNIWVAIKLDINNIKVFAA
jgi:hypothetical protein